MFKKLYILFLILSGTFTLTFGMIFASYVVTAGTLTANNGGYFQIYQNLIYNYKLILIIFGVIIAICVALSIVFAILDKQKN